MALGAWLIAVLGLGQCLSVMRIGSLVTVVFAAVAWFFAYRQRKNGELSRQDKTQILFYG